MDRLSQLHHDAEKARRDYLRPGVRFGFQVGPMRAVTPGEPHTTYVVPLYLTGTGDRYPRFICDVFGDIAVQAAANAAALGTIITDYLQSKVGTRFNIGNARAFLRLFST